MTQDAAASLRLVAHFFAPVPDDAHDLITVASLDRDAYGGQCHETKGFELPQHFEGSRYNAGKFVAIVFSCFATASRVSASRDAGEFPVASKYPIREHGVHRFRLHSAVGQFHKPFPYAPQALCILRDRNRYAW